MNMGKGKKMYHIKHTVGFNISFAQDGDQIWWLNKSYVVVRVWYKGLFIKVLL